MLSLHLLAAAMVLTMAAATGNIATCNGFIDLGYAWGLLQSMLWDVLKWFSSLTLSAILLTTERTGFKLPVSLTVKITIN